MAKQRSLGVFWYLPGKKKPFANSTKATKDLIALLYEQYQDLNVVFLKINYDKEARDIVAHYLDNGIEHIDIEY